MNLRVHILTPGFATPNGKALAFPLIAFRRAIRERGVDVHLFAEEMDGLTDCDLLIVDSKYHKDEWKSQSEQVLAQFAEWKARVPRLFYFDTTDSASWDHARVLPIVDGYFKNQVLRDRRCYLEPLYGFRLYTDYYHRKFGVADTEPIWSEPVREVDLAKIQVSWNSGMGDYSAFGPTRGAFYQRVPLSALIRYSRALTPPSIRRQIPVSLRMSTRYRRETISFQRAKVFELLQDYAPSTLVGRRRYLRELGESRIVVSPFGWGELNFKDYETFMQGALLVKPRVDHLETWPEFFREGETFVGHSWELDDVRERIENCTRNYQQYLHIAAQGQQTYARFTCSPEAPDLFSGRFAKIVAFRLQKPKGDVS